jgi:hypothetical protein
VKATTLDQLLKGLGYDECTDGVAAKDCKEKCNCDDYIMVYVHLKRDKVTADKAKALKKEYDKGAGGKDPFSSTDIFKLEAGEWHAMKGGADGSYTGVQGTTGKDNPAGKPQTEKLTEQGDRFGADMTLGKKCCCRKKKATLVFDPGITKVKLE